MGEIGKCVYNDIVAEPLTKKNREDWFEWVRNYLIAGDLWAMVDESSARPPEDEDHKEEFERWRKKSAATLHVIHISCGRRFFSYIRGVSDAKDAWHILNHKSKPKSLPQVTGEQVEFDVADLHKAIRDNNWRTAKEFFDKYPRALTVKLDYEGHTSLHLAAMFGLVAIVQELVTLAPPELLETANVKDHTPLVTAILYKGGTPIAECMVNKNSNIVGIPTSNGNLPVTVAFGNGHKEMGRYLYSVTPLEYLKPENGSHGANLLYRCFIAGALDVALDLLQRCRELLFATCDYADWSPIMGIATLPSAFANRSQLVFWKQWIYNYINIQSTTTTNNVRVDIQQPDESKGRLPGRLGLLRRLISHTYNFLGMKELHELKLVHSQVAQILNLLCENPIFLDYDKDNIKAITLALHRAAKEGNVEFVVQVSKACPQFILYVSRELGNIFFYVVKHRQAQVFNLIHGLRFKDTPASYVDKSENNMLHVAGELASSFQLNRISGPALQMQRELQWFKEVESVVPRGFKELKNKEGMQPKDVFKECHKELRKEGEKWMKATASSCSVVGTLVVTIMFAVAFTVPGGNNQDSGYPIFLEENLFVLFIISDALSLFSSSTSVLIFLGILTSRYAEEDFLKSLPTKLIIGLSTLLLSIATMMVAFSSCILLILQHKYSWSFLPVIMLASVPVTLFVLLQFPLLVQIVSSTYGRGIFNRNLKSWL